MEPITQETLLARLPRRAADSNKGSYGTVAAFAGSRRYLGAPVLAAEGALRLFAFTYLTRWFSFATQSYMLAVEKPLPASLISVSTALLFPALLLAALWPLGLTGIWLNFAGTALLAAALSALVLARKRGELARPDLPSRGCKCQE